MTSSLVRAKTVLRWTSLLVVICSTPIFGRAQDARYYYQRLESAKQLERKPKKVDTTYVCFPEAADEEPNATFFILYKSWSEEHHDTELVRKAPGEAPYVVHHRSSEKKDWLYWRPYVNGVASNPRTLHGGTMDPDTGYTEWYVEAKPREALLPSIEPPLEPALAVDVNWKTLQFRSRLYTLPVKRQAGVCEVRPASP